MSASPANINVRQLFFRIKAAINASKAGYGISRKGLFLLNALTWPALMFMTKVTFEEDIKEHHDRASKVNKNMPYMGNSTGVQFTWGVPCNYLDFECYHDFRKKKYDLSAVPRDVLFAGEVEAAHHH